MHLFIFNSSKQCLSRESIIFVSQKSQSHRSGHVQTELAVNCIFSCSFWAGENVPSPSTERFQRLLFWPLRAPGSLVCHHDLWPLQTSVLGGMSKMFTFSETDGVQVAPFFQSGMFFWARSSAAILSSVPTWIWWKDYDDKWIIHDKSHLYKCCFSDIHKWSDIIFTIIIHYRT